MGFVSDGDLVDVYNLATVYCQTSYAGSALPILEAMSCGTRTTCSEIECFKEHAGETAEYFDPQDVSDIVKAVKKTVNNKFDVTSQLKVSWEKTL